MAGTGKASKKLSIPYHPEPSDTGTQFTEEMWEERLVSDYRKQSFKGTDNMNVFEYWASLRSAVIHNLSSSEDGRQYLDRCWAYEQTDPDRDALRKLFKPKPS